MFNGLLRDFRKVWRGTLILAGGLTPAQAAALIDDGLTDLAAFGSPFIANPDFVERVRKGWPLTMARRSSYYGGGKKAIPTIPSMLKIITEAQPVKCPCAGTSGSTNLLMVM